MYSVCQIDKNGFRESNSAALTINFQTEKKRSMSSGMKFAELICNTAEKYVQNSPIIKAVCPTTYESCAAFEVHLRNPIEPTNLQYDEYKKKYLKLNLATKGIEWDWLKPPEVNLFLFKLFSSRSDEDTIPVGCFAFAGKKGNSYVRCHHPNVQQESGAICMGGFSGHEKMTELSIGSLSAMLRNFAIYSSYFKPVLINKNDGVNITVNTATIRGVIEPKNKTAESEILAKHVTIEEWL